MTTRRGKHMSLCPKSDVARKKLEKHPHVKAVILGTTDNCRHKSSAGTIQFMSFIPSGVKAKCYTGNGVVKMYIYCEKEHAEEVRALIK